MYKFIVFSILVETNYSQNSQVVSIITYSHYYIHFRLSNKNCQKGNRKVKKKQNQTRNSYLVDLQYFNGMTYEFFFRLDRRRKQRIRLSEFEWSQGCLILPPSIWKKRGNANAITIFHVVDGSHGIVMCGKTQNAKRKTHNNNISFIDRIRYMGIFCTHRHKIISPILFWGPHI